MQKPLRIAILAPVAWRTPPRAYGPWEQVASNVAEGLVELGHEVTLFATADSVTAGSLQAVVPQGYAENPELDAKVCEYMHLSYVMEQAHNFDVIHNHFDFMALGYSRLIDTPIVTTIHGFSSPKILPVYERYDDVVDYVSISNADRAESLSYAATVYNGLNLADFSFGEIPQGYLLYFGRIHPHKGAVDAIKIAKGAGRKLLMAGLVQDERYWQQEVLPLIDGEQIRYLGNSGPAQRRRVLAEASALLHPIHFDEPFGLSVAESMVSGTPVIAYARGAMPELIEPGIGGWLVHNIEEAIAACAKTSAIDRKRCRAAAVARFSRETMARGYADVFCESIKRKAKLNRSKPIKKR